MKLKFTFWILILGISGIVNIQAQNRTDQDRSDPKKEKLIRLAESFHQKYLVQRAEVERVAKEKGWSVRNETGTSTSEIQFIDNSGFPQAFITTNLNAGKTTNTDDIWVGGSTGLNLSGNGYLVGEWDAGGVLTTHQEFDNGGGTRVTQVDAPAATHYHSTHVAGTIVAEGQTAAAHGMATQALLHAYDWTDDLTEMASAASGGLTLSNHSYGYIRGWYSDGFDWYWYGNPTISATEDYLFGFYDASSHDWDQIAYNAPGYLIVKSAGNDRGDSHTGGHYYNNGSSWVYSTAARDVDGGADGYDCLEQRAVAKNVLTIGAVDDITAGWASPSDVVMSSFSAWGPTDDGRIKPDLVANGIGLYSTTNTGNANYTTLSGTSMSTPNTTGTLVLLQDYYKSLKGGTMTAAALKGLVINTANEAGPADGPDYKFGWGLLNATGATNLITSDNTQGGVIVESTLLNGQSTDYTYYSDGSNINVTLCWTDPAGTPVAASLNPTNLMLVNDLDVRVIGALTYYPWMLNPASPSANAFKGDNFRDNVETVNVVSPPAGYYTIRVNHSGTLSGGSQAYALIIKGMTTPPAASYCSARSTFWSSYESISNVTMGSINNTTGRSPGGFGDYTGMVNSIIKGTSETLTVTIVGFSGDQGKAWIDWNHDGDFADAGEEFVLGSEAGPVYTLSVTAPLTAVTGYTTMRVRLGYSTAPSACGTNSYGETEDYTIDVLNNCEALGGCDEYISNVHIGSINNSSACSRYADYTGMSTNIPGNSSAAVVVTNGTPYASDQCGVWVDWNNDGDFVDAGEAMSVTGTPGVGPYSATIAPPYGIPGGAKIMRVRIMYTGVLDPCGSTTYGEVEDYTINVTAPLPNYWTGGYNHYWHNASNWSLGHIPTAVEDAYITSSGYQPVWLSIYDDPCHDLNIQSGGTLQVIEKILTVNGNVNINVGGNLAMTNAAGIINVAGDWTDYAGVSGFTEGPGRVVFDGPGHQYVNSSETFNILEAKMGAALRVANAGYIVTCNQYDWTSGGIDVLSGTFTALDLADNGLFGTFWVNMGGILNLTQDAGQYNDLDGEIHIFGGVMTVTGGAGQSYWPYANNATIQMTGGVLDFKNNGINIVASTYSLTENITGGTIRTNGYFTGNRSDFTPSGGTIELYGTADASLSHGAGSNFVNLLINKSVVLDKSGQHEEVFYNRQGNVTESPMSNNVYSTSSLVLIGNLTIQAGTLVAPASINVAGNWTNSIGTAGFTEGTGTVTFNGSGHQFCYGETFNVLELNKPFMDLHFPAGSTTVCQSYDWTSGELEVEGGTFIANDLADDGIFGYYYITGAGGLLELHQDASHYVDLNGRIVIDNGTMNVYGGLGYSTWPYAANAALWMSGGVLDFKNAGIFVYDTPTYSLDDNITGGVIRTAGGFYSTRSDFTPGAGTFEFYGSSNVYLYELNGSKLFNVNVNKAAKGPENSSPNLADPRHNQISAPGSISNSVLLGNDFTISNDLTITSGSFVPNTYQAIVKNYCHVYGSLEMTNAADKLYVGTDAYDNLEFHAGSNSTLTAGGIYPTSWLYSSGAATVNSTSGNTIYFSGSGYTGIQVDGPGTVLGNLDVNKVSGNFYLNSWSGNTIELAGNLNLHAANVLDMQNMTMIVHGTATDNPTSTIYLYNGPGKSVNQGRFSAIADPLPVNVPATVGSLTIFPNFTLTGLMDISDGNVLVHGIFHLASTGSMNITTGSFISDATLHAKGWEYLDGHISLTSGLFEITHNSIEFGSTATTTMSGGTMRSGEAFSAEYAGTFHPTGGTVEIVGAGQNTIYLDNGNYFYNLLINRNPDAGSYLFTDITVNNSLVVNSGTMHMYGRTASVSGGITVNSGTLLCDFNGSALLAGSTAMNINSGGMLDVPAGAKVSHLSTGYYALNVNSGGTIAAHGTFEYMNGYGVNLLAGSYVEPATAFYGCTFQNGSAGGTLLTVNNSQVLTIRNAVFPSNTWGGTSNVSKTVNAGHVYFVDFSGGFSGEAYDWDGFNLIDWVPALSATATASPGAICAGSPSQLNITKAGGLAPFTYLWSPAAGLSNATIINPVATPLASTTYNVTVTDALGSAATSSIPVTVNPVLPVSVSIVVSANPVPPGTTVTFTATPVNGGSLPSYQWKVNGANIVSGSPTFSYVPSNNDQVTCVLTSNVVCPSSNPVTSNIIRMIVVVTNNTVAGSIPGPMSLCFDATNTITVAGGGTTFLVQGGASATMIAGVKISYLYGTTVVAGGYMHGYITTTNAYCGALPPSMVSIVAGSEGAGSEPVPSSRFSIYPNPANGIFTLSHNGDIIPGNVRVDIFDMRGDRILSASCKDERSHVFTLSDLSPGLYFVKVVCGEQVESLKLIITR
ncbi:MAG: GEVED domain-containing protein [Bacteroidetes bacterium]|nr:GEVED domain-containing protein [Bacteroidota bacterium]